MNQYLNLLHEIIRKGSVKSDRTGTGTISIFGTKMSFDLRKGFPLLTTKKVHFKSVVYELLWFLKGYTNTDYLVENGVTIWNEWATESGDLGPIYGRQWRSWDGEIDQLQEVIQGLLEKPNSRRHIVSAWNCTYLPNERISPQDNVLKGRMALAPCHLLFQFYVDDKYLDIQVYQRSADIFLGVPFNIASYALLLSIVAKIINKIPRNLHWIGGDTHLYLNHVEQAKLQLSRVPKSLSKLILSDHIKNIDNIEYEDIVLSNYTSYPSIKAPIAI